MLSDLALRIPDQRAFHPLCFAVVFLTRGHVLIAVPKETSALDERRQTLKVN